MALLLKMLYFGEEAHAADVPKDVIKTSSAARIVQKSISTDPWRFADDEPYAGPGHIGDGTFQSMHPGQALGHTVKQSNALQTAGKTDGPDVQVFNYNQSNVSDQQIVDSTAQTSIVVAHDKAPSYSPMRQ